MEEELVTKLINFVESASPVIWQAAQRQVLADIISGIIWIIAMVAVAVISFKLGNFLWTIAKAKNHYDDSFWYAGSLLSYTSVVICSLVALILLTSVIRMAVNPTYYAIYKILYLVK